MQYHSEKFLIIKNIKKFILDLEKLLVNFPNKDYLNKDMFYKEALNVLELVYNANEINDLKEKRNIQIQVLSKLNMLDFIQKELIRKNILVKNSV